MAEIKKISVDEFKDIASKKPFNQVMLGKDYFVTAILYLLKDIKGIYFKGGTALQKIFLDYSRLSEDVDFTVTEDVDKVKEQIKSILKESRLFEKITKDKDVKDFTRLVIHYKGFSDEDETVFIDLNKRAKLLMEPEEHEIKQFYTDSIPEFSVNTLAKEEMVAEKMSAAILRNKPRDHYDIYMAINSGIKIDIGMAKEKCRQNGAEFDIIRMFNKAKKLKNRWEEDLMPLLAKEISFKEVMQTLAKHFELKKEKEKIRYM